MTSDALVVYEDLPEGVTVMLRQQDGRDIIVIDEKLSRVERHRAHMAGKAKLRERRGQKILMPLALVTEWGTKLRELTPACRGPAATIAGGTLAMSLAVAGPTWTGETDQRPDMYLALPTPTSVARPPAPTATVSPVRRELPPSAKSSSRPPAPAVADAEPMRSAPTAKATNADQPSPHGQEAKPEADVISTEVGTPVRKTRPHLREGRSDMPASQQDDPGAAAPDLAKASDPPASDNGGATPTPEPAKEEKTSKPLLDLPLVDAGECDGLLNVDVALLPKVCVG